MASDWPSVSLKKLCGPARGITYGVVQPGTSEKTGIPILRADDIDNGRVITSNLMRVAPAIEASYERSRLRGGEVLLTLVGAYFGKSAVAGDEHAGFNTARAVGVIPVLEDAVFISYALRSPGCQAFIKTRATTTAQPTLNLRDVGDIPVPWPSKKAREKVSAILGALDGKIALIRRINEVLEAIPRALFKSWFIDFDPVRAKAERRDPCLPTSSADLFPDAFEGSEFREIPKGWRLAPISTLADIVGGTTPSTKEPAFWEGGTHHWATPKDLSALSVPVLLDTERRITDTGLQQISSGLLPQGTVLLSSRAPIGYIAIAEVPVAINQGFIAMKAKKGVSNLFLLLWASVSHDEIVSRANGSTFLEISKTNFRPILAVTPNHDVMDLFEEVVRPIYQRVVENERETRVLGALRDALLPRLISGELRVKDAEAEVVRSA
jgi:type I restriction enzyme S subunit